MPPVIFSNVVDGGDSSSSVSNSAKSTPTLDVVGVPVSGNTGLGIIGNGKTYHCQRCLNHGTEIPRKGHKRFCEYAACECLKCGLVEQRKKLNREINSEREKNQSPVNVDKMDDLKTIRARNPKCARCGVHVIDVEPPPLKGHKKICPFQNCTCKKCKLVTQRRSIMAKQIHLRRSQKAKNAATGRTGSVQCDKSMTVDDESANASSASTSASSSAQPPQLPTPPTFTSALCPSTASLTLRPNPTYPNLVNSCCPSALMSPLGNNGAQLQQQPQHANGHQTSINNNNHCLIGSLNLILPHVLSQQQQQRPPLPTVCNHYHAANNAVSLPQSFLENLYLSSATPTLGLPMVTAPAGAAAAPSALQSLLTTPAGAALLSEIVLQSTGFALPTAANHHNHHHHAINAAAHHQHHQQQQHCNSFLPTLLPMRNLINADFFSTLDRFMAVAVAASGHPPSSPLWSSAAAAANHSPYTSSLAAALRMPIFGGAMTAEEMLL